MVHIEQAAHGRRQRHVHLLVFVDDIEPLATFSQHTSHFKGHTIDEQPLANRIFITVQIPGHLPAQQHHPCRATHILSLEEITARKRPRLDRKKIRLYAQHRRNLRQVAGLETQTRGDHRRRACNALHLAMQGQVVGLGERRHDGAGAGPATHAAALFGIDHQQVGAEPLYAAENLLPATRGIVDRSDRTGHAQRCTADHQHGAQPVAPDLAQSAAHQMAPCHPHCMYILRSAAPRSDRYSMPARPAAGRTPDRYPPTAARSRPPRST